MSNIEATSLSKILVIDLDAGATNSKALYWRLLTILSSRINAANLIRKKERG
jgi:hypothetical protein